MNAAGSSPLRALRITCYVLIALLYIASVPWYRDADAPLVLWLGLPDWVAVAVLCYVAVAIVNALAWSLTDVPDELAEASGQPCEGQEPQEGRE